MRSAKPFEGWAWHCTSSLRAKTQRDAKRSESFPFHLTIKTKCYYAISMLEPYADVGNTKKIIINTGPYAKPRHNAFCKAAASYTFLLNFATLVCRVLRMVPSDTSQHPPPYCGCSIFVWKVVVPTVSSAPCLLLSCPLLAVPVR